MNRFQSQITYGILLTATGVFLAFMSFNPSVVIRLGVAAGLLLSAGFAFATALKSRHSEIPNKYNWLQGVGLLMHGAAVLFFGTEPNAFMLLTMGFLVYFGVTEIMFAFELSAYRKLLHPGIVGFKLLVGTLSAIGAVIAYSTVFFHAGGSLLLAGMLLTLMGANFVLLARLTKRLGYPY